ncbi:MAG: hypothetical protein AAGK32_05005, partial [Actinomycetota bacterium]
LDLVVERLDHGAVVDHGPLEIERAMPDDCPVVESFDDEVESLEADLVREACALADTPSPEVVVPEDLAPLFDGAPHDGRTEVPQRVGSLVTTGIPLDDPSPFPPGGALPGGGVPASLWSDEDLCWWVGDPVVAEPAGEPRRLGLTLRPRERLCVDLGADRPLEIDVLSAPTLGSGVVGRGRASVFRRGRRHRVQADGPSVFWNLGPGILEVEVRVGGPARRLGRWSELLRRRRTDRLADEVRAATA